MFDFPATPAPGDVYTQGQNSFTFNGDGWQATKHTQDIQAPPSDGNDYVRRNGVWVVKTQHFDWSVGMLNITKPAWNPKLARGHYFVGNPALLNNQVSLRASVDGTNFANGATNYYNAATLGQAPAAVTYIASAASASAALSYGGDNISVGHMGTFQLQLETVPGSTLMFSCVSTDYSNTNQQRIFNIFGYIANAPFTAGVPLLAFQLFLGNAPTVPTGGRVIVEWI